MEIFSNKKIGDIPNNNEEFKHGNSKQSKYEVCPAGIYQAVLNGVFELGVEKYEWKDRTYYKEKVIFIFELDETIKTLEDYIGQRFRISKTVNISGHKKSWLYKIIKTLTGDFNNNMKLSDLIGLNLQIEVGVFKTDDGKERNYIENIMRLPKNTPMMKIEVPFVAVPEWIEKRKEANRIAQLERSNINDIDSNNEILDDDALDTVNDIFEENEHK